MTLEELQKRVLSLHRIVMDDPQPKVWAWQDAVDMEIEELCKAWELTGISAPKEPPRD